jgi:hypothetical protein
VTPTEIAEMGAAALEAAYLAADKAWETDRRQGRWNLAQREERNAMAAELQRRRNHGEFR